MIKRKTVTFLIGRNNTGKTQWWENLPKEHKYYVEYWNKPETDLDGFAQQVLVNKIITCDSEMISEHLIVETHSEILLRSMQVEVAKGAQIEVKILLFEIDEKNAQTIKEIYIKDNGVLSDSIPDFGIISKLLINLCNVI